MAYSYFDDMVPCHLKKFGQNCIYILAVFATIGLSIFCFETVFAENLSEKVFLSKLHFNDNKNELVFVLPFSEKIQFVTYELDTPSCLIIDILGNNVFYRGQRTYRVNNSGIGEVRIVHFGKATKNNPVDLILFEFKKSDINYSIKENGSFKMKLAIQKQVGGNSVVENTKDSDSERMVKKDGAENIKTSSELKQASAVERNSIVKTQSVNNKLNQTSRVRIKSIKISEVPADKETKQIKKYKDKATEVKKLEVDKEAVLKADSIKDKEIDSFKPVETVSETVSQIVQPADYKADNANKDVFVVDGSVSGWQLWFENTLIGYQPLQISQEQVNLAQIRVRKERRGLFPSVNLVGRETRGDTGVGEESYEERRLGLGFEQPLTHGGELKHKLRRAIVNLDISKKEYNRIRADYLFKVKEAYYKLLLPKLDLIVYSTLLKKSKKYRDMIRQQYKKDLVTKDEYLSVESVMDQIYYRLRSIAEDFEVAKVNFKQALNLNMNTDIEVKTNLKLKKFFIDKSKCLKTAFKKRPELKVNRLVVDYNQLNREIAEAKQKFRVDFSGFLGQKGSNYTTEDLNMENEWSVGLTVTKAFGTNTATTSLSSQSAPPSLSQAGGNQDTNTAQFELSLMDKMDLLTNQKDAKIGYMKAVNELSRTKKAVSADVKSAYANYKKAMYQMKSAKNQIEKQSQRLNILRSRWKAEQARLSDVLNAELRMAGQESNYNKGKVSYYLALSNLAKACGVDSIEDLSHLRSVAKLEWDNEDELEKSSFVKSIDKSFDDTNNLQGHIMALTSADHNKFVIINLGQTDGIQKGMDLGVYRDGLCLGNIKIVNLRKNSSSCLVSNDISKAVQLGDLVKLTNK